MSAYYLGDKGSSNYTTAQEDYRGFLKHSFVERPATAIQKVIDKFSTISSLTTLDSPGTIDGSKVEFDEDFGPSTAISKLVFSTVVKLRKQEASLMKLHLQLQRDFETWGDFVLNPASKSILKESSNIMKTQYTSSQTLSSHYDEISRALSVINKKEKSMKKLLDDRKKLKKSVRDTAANHGENSYNVQAIEEQLESNTANLRVSENHYIKSINQNLRDAMFNYSLGLRSIACNYDNDFRKYDENVREAEIQFTKRNNLPLQYGLNELQVPKEKVFEKRNENVPPQSHCAKCSIEYGKSISCKADHHQRKRDHSLYKSEVSTNSLEHIVPHTMDESWA